MEMVKLKNGTEEAKVGVATTQMAINRLLADDAPYPMAFWELVRACQDDNHTPAQQILTELTKSGLVGLDGEIHTSVKNIVLSSVEGEGLDMTLVSPVAE